MFSYEEYYKLYNCRTEAEYQEYSNKLDEQLKTMDLPKEKGFREKVFWFLRGQGEFLQQLILLEKKTTPEYYQTASLRELQEDQRRLWEDIQPEAYKTSYTNPVYSSSLFGRELGPVLAMTAAYFREGIADVAAHRRFMLDARLKFYFSLTTAMTRGQVRAQNIQSLLTRQRKETMAETLGLCLHERYDAAREGLLEIIESEDLEQPYYLYMLGVPVSEGALRLRSFVQSLPESALEEQAQILVRGVKDGFARRGIDVRRKNTVALCYPLGMEALVKRIAALLRQETELEPFIREICFQSVNPGYDADHRLDEVLCIDEAYADKKMQLAEKLKENNLNLLEGCAGEIRIQLFGEEEPKQEGAGMDPTQEQLLLESKFSAQYGCLTRGAVEEKGVQTVMFLPSPDLGDRFEEIFREMLRLNSMDAARCVRVQQSLIRSLDRGTSVLIKGDGRNETLLTVGLEPLSNPKKQTSFYNAASETAIPFGDVSTCPRLQGTEGLLHLEEAWVQGVRYQDLKITFEDGYIKDYGCSNFEDPEEGRRFVYENLLKPADTLPVSGFSIGTNTEAFCMAHQHGIMDRLSAPLLKKMGLQITVGNEGLGTEKASPLYNSDKREMIARGHALGQERTASAGGEGSALPVSGTKAFTLPFDVLGRVTIQSPETMLDVIREGRFVLLGTDILNEPMLRREAAGRVEKKEE